MKTREYSFCVADFWMRIHLPEAWDVGELLPSFRPFLRDANTGNKILLDCTVQFEQEPHHLENLGEVIEETVNDMGHICLYEYTEGYKVVLYVEGRGYMHTMQATKDFSEIHIQLCPQDKSVGHMLSSMLRLAYSQAILYYEALAIHASTVYNDGRAYLFLGKSGTGKSTHSALWMKHIQGTGLLNDDNPTVRIVDGKAYVWGTPWSGKTPCYINKVYPIGGVVRLKQAAENCFYQQDGINSFVTLFPGCSVISQDEELRSRLYDTVSRLAEIVTIGRLECRPDREAAELCYRRLKEIDNKNS